MYVVVSPDNVIKGIDTSSDSVKQNEPKDVPLRFEKAGILATSNSISTKKLYPSDFYSIHDTERFSCTFFEILDTYIEDI